MKDYLAKPKPTSDYSEELLEAYLAQGGNIQSCSHGESGGHTALMKEMIAKSVNKANRKRKTSCKQQA
jgi:hypothetical protein